MLKTEVVLRDFLDSTQWLHRVHILPLLHSASPASMADMIN